MFTGNIVKEVMTTDLIVVHPNDLVSKIQEIFESNNFHHLPVIDDDQKLIGLISRYDYNLLCDKSTLFKHEKSDEINERFFSSMIASDIMTKDLVTLKEEAPLSRAVDLIRENLFHAIPIVDDHNTLVGLVTTYDLLTFAYQQPLSLTK